MRLAKLLGIFLDHRVLQRLYTLRCCWFHHHYTEDLIVPGHEEGLPVVSKDLQ